VPSWWIAAAALAGPAPIDEVPFGPWCRPIPHTTQRDLPEGVPGNALRRRIINVDGRAGEPEDRLHPEALCNDGSPGIYYVRAGALEHRDDWIIHLDAGSGCDTAAACVDRWCGRGFYTAEKMSSLRSHSTLRGFGIFDGDPERNAFAGWNHVFVYYCTSDFWTGTTPAAVLSPAPRPGPAFTLNFTGVHVLDAVLSELQDHPTKLTEIGLPDLDAANTVLLTGSSAGAVGLSAHVDRVADALRVRTPGVRVRAIADSFHPPSGPTRARDPWGSEWPADHDAELRAMQARVEAAWEPTWDASCLAAHPDDSWRCYDGGHVWQHHTSTSLFSYQDQADPLICPDGCAVQVRHQLRSLAELDDPAFVADEAVEYAGDLPQAWFSPRCGHHTALASAADGGRRFLADALPDRDSPDATWWTYHDAVGAWLDGGVPRLVRSLAPGPSCPDRPDD
jgi:hypothetical protein